MKHVWMLGIAMVGCIEATERAPEKVRTGAYEVTVETRSDSCSPRRPDGDAGVTDVFVSAEGISPMVPTSSFGLGFGFQRHEMRRDEDFTSTSGRGIVVGTECGGEARFLTRREVVEADEEGMVLRSRTEWTVTKRCEDDGGMLGEMPEASCRVDQDIRYELVLACDAPCQLRGAAPDAYRCECPE